MNESGSLTMLGGLAPFLRGLLRHWKASITSGVIAALLFVAERWGGFHFARGVIGFFVCCAIVTFAFQLWREERAGRLRALEDLEKATQRPEPIVRMLSDPEYWLLTKVSAWRPRVGFRSTV